MNAITIGRETNCSIKVVRMILFFLCRDCRFGPVTTGVLSKNQVLLEHSETEKMEGSRKNKRSWVCEDGEVDWVISL